MMLRSSIVALLHRRVSIRRVPRQASAQISSSVCPRRAFSTGPQHNVAPGRGSTSESPEPGRNLPKVLVGSVAIGTCFFAAYARGYFDDILGKKQESFTDLVKVPAGASTEKLPKGGEVFHNSQNNNESVPILTKEGPKYGSDLENAKISPERQSAVDRHEDSSNCEKDYTHTKEEELPKCFDDIHSQGEKLSESSPDREKAAAEIPSYHKLFKDGTDMEGSGQKAKLERHETDEKLPTFTEARVVLQGDKKNKDLPVDLSSKDETEAKIGDAHEVSTSLLDAYHLRDQIHESTSTPLSGHIKHSSSKEETSRGTFEDLSDAYVSKDGKLILDFLQAIHAAEQRQAELDALVFSEEKRAMKEKYEKELKDARARELMYAEEAAMLEKEVKKERAKAASALKSLQEGSEERLKRALEEKEREAESKLKELQEFAKAELAASVAREKAAQIEKMAEANLNINALCMSFYARSEEARQTHSIHKLALGALALEEALSNGLPVQAEIDALHIYAEGADKHSLVQLALSSLPEDVRVCGTDSLLQLNQKFDALKGALRHFSLIPPEGGGILAHSLAHVASFLKVKEDDRSGDGIDSVINKVENLLARGKLAEAADALEDGVKGSKASEVVSDWLRRARNRAITEQALVLLQSYANSVSLLT